MKQKINYLQFAFKVLSDKDLTPIALIFEHTEHSYLRACQRSLNKEKIATTLQYGEIVHKQGLIFYILGEKNIPDSLRKQKEKLKNTIVVVAGDSNRVITCYRSKDPFKNVRVKPKRLSKRYKNTA